MDFSKLGSSSKKVTPTDPIQLFEALPSLPTTPNDLWRGQAEALKDWHDKRSNQDVLVSLNTGAGKTIVGILIAQSLVNEGLENVVYVCSTRDLVLQTAKEAERIGIKCTTRLQAGFDNDLFETGRSFCITTYSALFNGHSSIRRRFFPKAIIFDDAHVAEGILRDSFTLRIDSTKHTELFKDIARLFKTQFDELGIQGQYRDSIGRDSYASCLVPPSFLRASQAQLSAIFQKHDIRNDKNLTYAYSHLEDHLEACAAIFTNGTFEIAPPFLPSLALDIFEQKVRRVYLSATLQSYAEFVRAYGRKPSAVVEPTNDAGNGERLIITGSEIAGGITTSFANELSKQRKVLIATPSYNDALAWKAVAEPPKVENFSDELNKFREKSSGAFSLVSRVDGIDLPHDTCRIMIMDGLPSGSSLLERYQWEYLRMTNLHALRVSNRIAQLFGRINRGRNDFGVFLVQGHDLTVWMKKDRNIALLSPLLQKQILVGRTVQDGMPIKNTAQVTQAIDTILGRDQSWIDYYEQEVKLDKSLDQAQVDKKNAAEPHMVDAALSEAQYAKWMWLRDYSKAWKVLEESSDKIAQYDTPIAGWQSIWMGAALEVCGDRSAALRSYAKAKSRLGTNVQLPRPHLVDDGEGTPALNPFGSRLSEVLSHSNGNKITQDIAKLEASFGGITSGSPNQAEAAVRELGEILGYNSTRPDNDHGTGPDVLWVDEVNNECIAFELKTDKEQASTYTKDDIGQGHNHLSWISSNHKHVLCLGLLFVGPDLAISGKASPSPQMSISETSNVVSVAMRLIGLMKDVSHSLPLERQDLIRTKSVDASWSNQNMMNSLVHRRLGVPDDTSVLE